MKKHEDILVFGGTGYPNYYPQGLVDGEFKTGRNADMTGKVYSQYKNHGTSKKGNYPKTTLEIPNPSNRGNLHPTQKPVALFEYLIKTYTQPGAIVLDNCAGSGTTGEACDNTGRRFVLIEQEKKYCDIIKKRVK